MARIRTDPTKKKAKREKVIVRVRRERREGRIKRKYDHKKRKKEWKEPDRKLRQKLN